ncbi:nuclear factor 7, ovary-like [Chanos chanos]|uniref:Nuclear factor 7, ovary-like n=1 Tax=Chanos chanos TaxID=29144 RepID=A0A6J2WX71_CHACN|nr:nuclear factor 7, ovary-like [Chanos chanos]
MWPLLYTVKTTERDSRLEGVTFLQDHRNNLKISNVFLQKYQFTMKRIWQCKQSPEKVKSSLINVSEHVGNLRFRVWNKMQQITPYTPVTLNPNTANSFLLVSDDLTTVRDSGEDEDDHADDEDQKLPDTAERFTCCGEMLGFEGFDSGSHNWVVEVGDSSDWIVGVAGASVSRKSLVAACPENRIWGMSLRRGLYEALESPSVRLLVAPSVPHQTTPPPRRPRRVRVCLDWDRHRVNFSDPDNGRHLYTFMHTFSEKLFPYFSTSCVSCPLKIVPATVTITMSCQGQEEEEVEGESLLEMSVKSGLRVLDYLTIPEPKHLPNL